MADQRRRHCPQRLARTSLRVGDDAGRISLAALKFNSDTIEAAKEITTEGISDDDRAAYIHRISESAGGEIFEFSTCNRVLYVGFGVEPSTLTSTSADVNQLQPLPQRV